MDNITEMTANMSLSVAKRKEYINWQEYFMGLALLAAKRSKDPKRQVGACIVNKYNIIISLGYNGMPNGCHDDLFPWIKDTPSPLDSKLLYVCHAEMNAILNKNAADLKDCIMYVTLFPCNECAKMIIQSGIKEVYYLFDGDLHKPKNIASKTMLNTVGVKLEKYKPQCSSIEISFIENNGSRDDAVEPDV